MMSITVHVFIFLLQPLIQDQVLVTWVGGSREAQTRSSAPFASSSGGIPTVLRPAKRYNLYNMPYVCPWVSPWIDMPITPSQGGIRRLPDQVPEPPQLAPLTSEEWHLCFELLSEV